LAESFSLERSLTPLGDFLMSFFWVVSFSFD
jgi:hypothetical protein